MLQFTDKSLLPFLFYWLQIYWKGRVGAACFLQLIFLFLFIFFLLKIFFIEGGPDSLIMIVKSQVSIISAS